MNGLEIAINGYTGKPSDVQLVTLVRRDKGYSDHPCHLFAYTGEKEPYHALIAAVHDYLTDTDKSETVDSYGGDFDWHGLMADASDYGETFAKHGLTEIYLPMGMTSVVVDNSDIIEDY